MTVAGGQRSSPPVRASEAARAAARPAGGAKARSDDASFSPASGCDWIGDGAEHHSAAATPLLPVLDAIAAAQPQHRAGTRLHGLPELAALLATGPIHAVAARHIGPAARPVRAILFDKTAAANWSLGWHQDRTIAVRGRHDVPGYGPWTVKQAILHVAPPFAVIAGMATLRIHLDDVPADNAPLLIAPGSHRLGVVPEREIDAAVARHGTCACLAQRGDVWAYATPILHASPASTGVYRRRVLQVDYAARPLDAPLQWLGL